MSVDLQPAELGFRRPFDHEVTEILTLHNGNSAPLAFKVKTTAPKQYCVRPNSGTISSGQSVDVQVLLQAMKEQPPLDAKCRDKFLVQTVAMSSEADASNLTGFWQGVEKTNKSSIQERKIRVNFLPESHDATVVNGVSSSPSDEPPAYSSPTPQFGSPAPPDSASRNTMSNSTTSADGGSAIYRAAEATGVTTAAAAVANVIPTSSEDFKAQLSAANAQITKLKNQLADPQLRQRKIQETTANVQAVVQQTNEGGVPLQIVAGLCLLSFLLAYFFF